jgi:hypothetical protein
VGRNRHATSTLLSLPTSLDRNIQAKQLKQGQKPNDGELI